MLYHDMTVTRWQSTYSLFNEMFDVLLFRKNVINMYYTQSCIQVNITFNRLGYKAKTIQQSFSWELNWKWHQNIKLLSITYANLLAKKHCSEVYFIGFCERKQVRYSADHVVWSQMTDALNHRQSSASKPCTLLCLCHYRLDMSEE